MGGAEDVDSSFFDPRQHTVGIYEFEFNAFVESKPGHGELRGSGVFADLDGRHVVITAAHVLEGGIDRIGFAHRDGPMIWIGHSNNLHVVASNAIAFEGDPNRVQYRDGLDVAVIVLSDPVRDDLLKGFRPYRIPLNYDPGIAENFVVCGWPAEFNKSDPFNDRMEFGCWSFEGDVGSEEDLLSLDGNPNTQFAVGYNSTAKFTTISGDPMDLPSHLHGLSGGGVWATTDEAIRTTVECAASLHGIVFEDHNPTRPFLKAVKIGAMRTPLIMAYYCARFNIADQLRAGDVVGWVTDCKNEGLDWTYKLSLSEPPTLDDPNSIWVPESQLTRP